MDTPENNASLANLYNSSAILDLLVEANLLTPQQREFVIENAKEQRDKLRKKYADKPGRRMEKGFPDMIDIILSMNMGAAGSTTRPLTEDLIMRAVAHRLRIPYKKLDPLELDMDIVTKSIPKTYAITHLLLPFEVHDGILSVAIYNPAALDALRELERVNKLKTRAFLSTKSDIKKILAEFFGFQTSITAAESHFGAPREQAQVDIGNLEQYFRITSAADVTSSDQHIKAAVNHLFHYALEQRASDVHIEPKRETCHIRFRIDGVLHTIYKLPKVVHSAIVSRIKSMSRLDIAEKRRPQDGRIKIATGGEDTEAEVRVSTVPVAFGEKVVMRLLDPEIIFQDIDKLGFSKRDLVVYNSFTTSPHGIILVTGPTGSGKSTTLYSTLKRIATPEKNIVTIEDPVEMVYEEFNQIAVQPAIDVTFSSILRNILRQDPDVIMIGEIRDLDTAHYAVQAALTGHLVFSTLHTNDAVSSIVRLKDLGLEPFLVASTLVGAMAQRLVRRICPHCVETYSVDAADLRKMGFPVNTSEPLELQRGKGCHQCRGTGYKGRSGVFEIFPMSEQLKKLIKSDATAEELRQVAIREGMTTLREDTWNKVRQGITTVEEAIRVTTDAF